MKFQQACAAVTLILVFGQTGSAIAHDNQWRRGHHPPGLDHARSHGHHHAEKERYWDGNCKVKREWKRNGDYKEERKCRGRDYHDHHYVSADPVIVVNLPPWFNVVEGETQYHDSWEPAPPRSGRAAQCHSSQVGSVLGGLIGGVLGHQIGGGRGKTAATIGGTIAGVLIGGEMGERMDANNQACVAQSLEFAPEGERISWQDAQGDQQYTVIPGQVQRRGDDYCRSYRTEVQDGRYHQSTDAVACRRPDGTWVHSS